MKYKCGCEASGDNIANYCPVHGEPEIVCVKCGNAGWITREGISQCDKCGMPYDPKFTLPRAGTPGYSVIGTAWKPISTAPKDTDVLVCDFYEHMTVARFESGAESWQLVQAGWEAADTGLDNDPLFWMELPKAPKDVVKKQADNSGIAIRGWLLGREGDIAVGLEDFGEIRQLFIEIIGREPTAPGGLK